jgi:hypothetical protein
MRWLMRASAAWIILGIGPLAAEIAREFMRKPEQNRKVNIPFQWVAMALRTVSEVFRRRRTEVWPEPEIDGSA